mmetsp:Transcript_17317/g.30374  ORF Transcript_17317/g.30374 Transcript_17317/m.30374 type:complete len:247 (+) Transcript_17317:94-834(+)
MRRWNACCQCTVHGKSTQSTNNPTAWIHCVWPIMLSCSKDSFRRRSKVTLTSTGNRNAHLALEQKRCRSSRIRLVIAFTRSSSTGWSASLKRGSAGPHLSGCHRKTAFRSFSFLCSAESDSATPDTVAGASSGQGTSASCREPPWTNRCSKSSQPVEAPFSLVAPASGAAGALEAWLAAAPSPGLRVKRGGGFASAFGASPCAFRCLRRASISACRALRSSFLFASRSSFRAARPSKISWYKSSEP